MVKEYITWFGEFVKFVQKYGVLKSLAYLFLFLFFSYVAYIAVHPQILFEKYSKYNEQMHNESFKFRMEATPVIQSLLDQMTLETGSMRSFVVEMHNGKYNAAGLSFNYGALTYESVRENTYSIAEDYADFSIERYPIISKIYKVGYWSGNVDELMLLDRHLALRLESNDCYWIATIMIYGSKGEIGFLGVTFGEKDDVDSQKVKRILIKYASKLSPLLDGPKR